MLVLATVQRQSLANLDTGIAAMFASRSLSTALQTHAVKNSRSFSLQLSAPYYGGFHIGTSYQTSVPASANSSNGAPGKGLTGRINGKYRLDDTRRRVADDSEAEKTAGRSSKVKFEERISELVQRCGSEGEDRILRASQFVAAKGIAK